MAQDMYVETHQVKQHYQNTIEYDFLGSNVTQ